MASSSCFEAELTCPVCHDIYNEPVVLPCSHSFCRDCLQRFWGTTIYWRCPVCRKLSSTKEPPLNLALRNLSETFRQAQWRSAAAFDLCSLHDRSLELFCVEDEELICQLCLESKSHSGHRLLPKKDAALQYKKELNSALKIFQEQQKTLKDIKESVDQTMKYVEDQKNWVKLEMMFQFEALQRCLREYETTRRIEFDIEAQEKIAMIKEISEQVTEERKSRDVAFRFIEMALGTEDLVLLKNIKETKKRIQMKPLRSVRPHMPVIDVAKHLGNLKSEAWKEVRNAIRHAPVILDPNTASAHLRVSEDLTRVDFNHERLPLPPNPERFSHWDCVLGSEGFESGLHCWEVDVQSNRFWDVGVTVESNKERGSDFSWEKVWSAGFRDGHPHHPGSNTYRLEHAVNSIQVKLDMDHGQLSFFDPGPNKRLHTFHVKFTERVYPFFHTLWPSSYMMVLPEMKL